MLRGLCIRLAFARWSWPLDPWLVALWPSLGVHLLNIGLGVKGKCINRVEA